MAYLHGTYGELGETIGQAVAAAETGTVALGTAPVNLIQGYATAGIINMPVKVESLTDVKNKVGYSDDWDKFTLCEVATAHFDNGSSNIGPVYFINVLDPDTHRATSQTTANVSFANGTGYLTSDTVILDTITLADSDSNELDFTVSYNFSTGQAVLKTATSYTGQATATYYDVDTTLVTDTVIIGGASDGTYTGIEVLDLMYPAMNVIPALLEAPTYSTHKAVYDALCEKAKAINERWFAFVVADIPVSAATRSAAIAWKATNGYKNENSKVCWPMFINDESQKFHMSTLCVCEFMRQDISTGGAPYRTCSNQSVNMSGLYVSDSVTLLQDTEAGNALNAEGITTGVNWGGSIRIWGGHTAAYNNSNTDQDARSVFDTNIRMLYYILNDFQDTYKNDIDTPMTVTLKDNILVEEQKKLDAFVADGGLIGSPTVQFLRTNNTDSDIVEGNFTWNINTTVTPQLKSVTAIVSYTTEGFSAYFEEE